MKIAKTAPDALKILWKEEVFFKAQGLKEIEKELEKKGYNFTSKNLMMSLKRIKFLTRKGEAGNYTYVQKHPYVEEDKNGK